jgi:hypothetical protein
MKTYSIIKRNFGTEINQVSIKIYKTKEAAINAGRLWEYDCNINSEAIKGRNFEVIEKKEK